MAGPGGVLVGRGYVSIRPEFEGDWSRSVNARASGAGRGGAAAFGKAFSAGLKGVGVLAGVAVAANLQNIAAAATLAAPAIATVATAAGAVKLGLSGVGDAFKAAFADQTPDIKASASATRQVEAAQRSLADAQRRVADAQRALADARVQADGQVKQAQQDVRDAERDLTDAQREARSVQADLNDARVEATRALQDMNTRLSESRLDERDAVLRQKEAEKELKAAQAKPGTTPDQLAKLQLAYDRATLNLRGQRTETQRLADDTKKANKAGVEGSDQVLAAKQRISGANQAVADKERVLATAQAGVDKARLDGQRQIADAQRGVADAQRGVAEAAQALADAQSNAALTTSKLDAAMAKLAPNARAFVTSIKGLAPAWDAMRLGVQNRMFAGLDTAVTSLGRRGIPTLRAGLTGTAGVLNQMAKSAIGAVAGLQRSGMLAQILAGANKNLAVFADLPGKVITAFGKLTVAAQPAFHRLLTQVGGGLDSLFAKLDKAFASGGLSKAIGTAMDILGQLGTILANAFGVVENVFKAASASGGQILGIVSALLGELKRLTALPEVQAALKAVFQAVAQIAGALAKTLGAAIQAVMPLLAAIAPVIGQLATALGPVLAQLATALGQALLPVVKALLPAVTLVGNALVQVVNMITPLLAPIGQLLTAIINALMPVVKPLLNLVMELVQSLIGPLMTVISAIVPVVQVFGQVLAGLMTAIRPVLGPLVGLLSQVAETLAGLFADAISRLLGAIRPLIPIGLLLVRTVLGALTPILPVIAAALQQVIGAFAGLLPMVAQVWSQLASQLAPVLRQLAPVLAQVATTIVTGLAQILPSLIGAFITLIGVLRPLYPLFGQLLAQIIPVAGKMWQQLLPALAQLIEASVELLVALAPLLPPLVQLLTLTVQLAASVLTKLLPPLVTLAGFLVVGVATAIATVIGWVASINSWFATKLGPTVTWLGGIISTFVTKVIGGFRWLYNVLIGHSILPDIIRFIRLPFAGAFTWLYNSIVKPVWNGIKTTISTVWTKGIRPAFNALKTAIGRVADSFRTAKDGIGKAWHKIEDLTKKPIAFVINTVYNKGIVGLWNTAAKVLPIGTLTKMPLPKGFARGGVLPGYTPGQDVHRFYSPTGGLLNLSGGESVMRPEFTRAVGASAVYALNDAARTGGVAGVRSALGVPGYAKGGIIGDHGGIGDWFGGTIKKIGSALGKAKDWVLGNIAKAAGVAAKPIRALIDHIPGGKTGFGKLATALPKGMLDAALRGIKGSEESQLDAGGQWIKPVNVPYGTRFGVRGKMWSSGYHTGLDFPAPVGTPVHAVAAGQIASALSGGPYGNHILINHGHGLQSLYAHLSRILARSGAVSQGKTIGKVGATGNVTGPHLHLEARLNGKPVDPMQYLTGGNLLGGVGSAVAVGSAQRAAQGMLKKFGWGPGQFGALKALWQHESGWRWNALNPSSGAYGIPQCVDLDTRILTRRGWLRHDEVEIGDETIGYNVVTGGSEPTRITEVYHYDRADMVTIEGVEDWTARCTPGHRWLRVTDDGRTVFVTAAELAPRMRLRVTDDRTVRVLAVHQRDPEAVWCVTTGLGTWTADQDGKVFLTGNSLPASKMGSAGSDWRTNPVTQIQWGMGYIKGRYGSPSKAWSFWNRQSPHWYDQGGWLQPGTTLVHNGTGSPEPVLTRRQLAALEGSTAAAGAEPVVVEVHTRDAALAGFIDVRVRQGNAKVLTALGARPTRR